MSSWHFRINVKFPPARGEGGDAATVAALFGLHGAAQVLYEDFRFSISPGQIVAVVGPSGAGKSALLAQAAVAAPEAIRLDLERLAADDRPAVEAIDEERRARRQRPYGHTPVGFWPTGPGSAGGNGQLKERLEVLSRCGLAEAAVLVTPASRLSGGQQYRLALARAIWRAVEGGHAAAVPAAAKRDTRGPDARDTRDTRGPDARDTCGRGVRVFSCGRYARRTHTRAQSGRLLLVDEFGATLDAQTARVLATQMRKLVSPDGPYRRAGLAMIVSVSRPEVTECLQPDMVIVKPLGEPPVIANCEWPMADCLRACGRSKAGCNQQLSIRNSQSPKSWPIVAGTLADYRALAQFHYLAGPPSGHKRVWVIRPPGCDGIVPGRARPARPHNLAVAGQNPTGVCPYGQRVRALQHSPGQPAVAAVLVVSPPVRNCRGRNLATGGRYTGPDAAAAVQLLNAELECISRVIVHPIHRGCGLAVRLVRHALARAGTPLVEALAAMGAVHPMFELAGMKACHAGRDRHAERFLSAADAVGLSQADVAGVEKIRRIVECGLGKKLTAENAEIAEMPGSQREFLLEEMNHYIRRTLPRRLWGTRAAIAEACRRATAVPVYYLGHAQQTTTNAAQTPPKPSTAFRNFPKLSVCARNVKQRKHS